MVVLLTSVPRTTGVLLADILCFLYLTVYNLSKRADQKLLTAGITVVRFVPSVAHLVLQQLPLHVERLSTLVTGERLFCGVSLFVVFEIAEVAETW